MTQGPHDIDGESPWSLTVRNRDLEEIEALSGYERIRLELLDSNVGQFTVRIGTDNPAVPHLLEEGSGVVIRPRGQDNVIVSGWVLDTFLTERRDSKVGSLTVMGVDDNILFADLAYPDPDSDVSTTNLTTFGQTHDVRSGPAETVLKGFAAANIGPSAGVERRRYPFLNIPASAGLGSPGSWRARFADLLGLCQDIAVHGGLSFRIAQSAPGELTLYVWEPEDRIDVRFSVQAQNLTAAVLTRRAPDLTEIVAGGGGEGTDRGFIRRGLDGSNGLFLTGEDNDNASTPDHSSLDITNELDIRIDLALDNWNPGGNVYLFGKYDFGDDQRSYMLRIGSAGTLQFLISTDGSGFISTSAGTGVPAGNGERIALRATASINPANGDYTVSFFRASTIADDTWTPFGDQPSGTATNPSFFNSDASLVVGTASHGVSPSGPGVVYAVELYGDGGTLVASADFAKQAHGATSFADDAGRTWSVNNGAIVINQPVPQGDWGRRSSKFMDRRSLEGVSEFHREMGVELYEGAVTAGMTLYPIEQVGTLFGVDYQLGDIIPVVVQGVELREPVRRIVIEHEAGKAPDVVPDVGLPVLGVERPEDSPLIRSMIRNLISVTRS